MEVAVAVAVAVAAVVVVVVVAAAARGVVVDCCRHRGSSTVVVAVALPSQRSNRGSQYT